MEEVVQANPKTHVSFGKTRVSFFVYKFVKLMTFTVSAEDFHRRLEYPVFIKCLNGL